MTYSSGQPIAASDYNGFVTSVNTVLSAYGQTTLASVTGGTSVVTSSGQWAALGANINLLATHQGTTVSSYTSQFGSGTVVSAIGTVSADVTSISATANIYNAGSQGTLYSTFGTSPTKTTATGSGSAAWTITFTSVVAFGTNNAANAFFNAGGRIQIQFGKTSTGTVADTEWNSFVGAAGAGGTRVPSLITLTSTAASKTINGSTFTGVTVAGGAGTITNQFGWAQLPGTNAPQQLYIVYDTTTAYSSNYIKVSAANDGNGNLTITTVWYDAGDANPGSTAQISGGAAVTGNPVSWPSGNGPSTLVTYIPPASNLTNNGAWGTPLITNTVA